ncbi:MAG: hypothetical protein R3F61_22090 [Myxococcota bacterium]
MAKQRIPSASSSDRHASEGVARLAWAKPKLQVHGDLATLTRAKSPGGVDSGLGTAS